MGPNGSDGVRRAVGLDEVKKILLADDQMVHACIGSIDLHQLMKCHDMLVKEHSTWIPHGKNPSAIDKLGVYIIRGPEDHERDTRYNHQKNSFSSWSNTDLNWWEWTEHIGRDVGRRLGIPEERLLDETDLQFTYRNFKSKFGHNPSDWWHTDKRKTCVINVVVKGHQDDYMEYTDVDYGLCQGDDKVYEGMFDPKFVELCESKVFAKYSYTVRHEGYPVPTLLNSLKTHRAHSFGEDRILFSLAFAKSSFDQVKEYMLANDC